VSALAYHYRLPTEAEWEHAAQAGSSSEYFFGNNESFLAWMLGITVIPVIKRIPLGKRSQIPGACTDIYGNVREWVQAKGKITHQKDFYMKFSSAIITAFLAVLMCSSFSEAKVQKFKYFSVDVPEGWVAQEIESGTGLTITTKRKSGLALAVMLQKKDESMTLEQQARAFAKKKNINNVEDLSGDGSGFLVEGEKNVYMFTDIGNGLVLRHAVLGKDKILMNILKSIQYDFPWAR